MENWSFYSVTERELDGFTRFNTPIEIPHGIVKPNGGVLLIDEKGKSVPAMFSPKEKGAVALTKHNPIKDLRPKNKDLHLLYTHLQSDDVQIVTVDGFFGTAKTSTVMAHVVERMTNDHGFKVYLTKPHVPHGKSYGHLPGTLDEKTDPEFESFYQYINRFSQRSLESWKLSEQVNIAPLEYIRGRDFPEAWVIVDEAQNLTFDEAITLASRVAKGGKLILLGDSSPWQRDTKRKDDGLTQLVNLLQGTGLIGCTEFKTVEHVLRGDIAKALIKELTKKDLSA